MYGLLMTFVRRGGHALHINVFDADTLRAGVMLRRGKKSYKKIMA
jgi:hypothetical protein